MLNGRKTIGIILFDITLLSAAVGTYVIKNRF